MCTFFLPISFEVNLKLLYKRKLCLKRNFCQKLEELPFYLCLCLFKVKLYQYYPGCLEFLSSFLECWNGGVHHYVWQLPILCFKIEELAGEAEKLYIETVGSQGFLTLILRKRISQIAKCFMIHDQKILITKTNPVFTKHQWSSLMLTLPEIT